MTPEETSESPRRDWFVRAAAGIGDFGNPFYAEERQRDVWNEASAFGLQLLLWLSMLTATISVWVFGAPAVPYALSLLALVSVAAIATASYAARLGVTDSTALKRAQMLCIVPYDALLVLFFVGVFRALPPLADGGEGSGTFLFNVAVGAAVGGGAVLLIGIVRYLRRGTNHHALGYLSRPHLAGEPSAP
jgi:hypothetical protein